MFLCYEIKSGGGMLRTSTAALSARTLGGFDPALSQTYRISGHVARTFPDFDALKKANFYGLDLA